MQGLTLMFLAVDLSLFFNSYVNPVALDALKWKYYIVYDVWLAFELLIVYLFYIETQNTALEEIVKFFEGGYTTRIGYGLHYGWAIEGAVGSAALIGVARVDE